MSKAFAIKVNAAKLVGHLLEHVKSKEILLTVVDDGSEAAMIIKSVINPMDAGDRTKWLMMRGELEFIELADAPVDLMVGNEQVKIQ